MGGVLFDVNMEWVDRVRKFLKEIPADVYDEIDNLLTRNRIFIDRTKGIGVLSREDAINLRRDGADGAGERRGARFAQG